MSKTTAKFFKIYPQRVRTIYDNYTLNRYEQLEAELASKIGLDETSTKNGQILDIQDGRSSEVVANYAKELRVLGKPIESIKEFSIDMSPAFISGVKTHFSNARMTFDRFHVIQLINRYLKPL